MQCQLLPCTPIYCQLSAARSATDLLSVLAAVPWNLTKNPVRVLAGAWLLVALIVGTVYRSNLKAMLIIPKVVLPFDNLEELVESGIPIAVLQSTVLHQAIMVRPAGTVLCM